MIKIVDNLFKNVVVLDRRPEVSAVERVRRALRINKEEQELKRVEIDESERLQLVLMLAEERASNIAKRMSVEEKALKAKTPAEQARARQILAALEHEAQTIESLQSKIKF